MTREQADGYRFIVREPESGTRTALQEYLDEHRIQPTFVMEMPSNGAIKQAVMAEMGVSLLSLHVLALKLSNGMIAVPTVEGLPVVRRWNAVNAAAKLLSPVAETFRYFILEHGEAPACGCHVVPPYRRSQSALEPSRSRPRTRGLIGTYGHRPRSQPLPSRSATRRQVSLRWP